MRKASTERSSKAKELNYDFFEINFKDVLSKNPGLATKIDIFMDNVSQKYQPIQANLIRRAVVLGTVAHQNNEIETKRFRKAGNGNENPTPYFIHPIEMAESMISSSKENPTFDWITIAATLLHDVPEDVKLNGVEGRDAWLSTITEAYKDTGYQYMLTSIIDGVTERKLPSRNTDNETEKLYERLEKSPMYKMIIGYIKHGGIRHIKEDVNYIDSETRKSVSEVVYNLENLFLSATQSPEELRIFFIKIADVWHNLQSPEWVKDIKVLRGRIAAGLAELLGWNLMRNKIIVSLAKITDVSTPYSSHTEKKSKALFNDGFLSYLDEEQSADLGIAKQIIPQMLDNPKSLPVSFKVGFPIPHSETKNPLFAPYEGEETTLPQPEIDITMSNELFDNLTKVSNRFGVLVEDSRNTHGMTFVSIKNKSHLMGNTLSMLGRRQTELFVKPGNRKSFTMSIEDDQPHIIDMFTLQSKNILPTQIPEFGLFNNDFGQSSDLLNTHIHALIGFCYEPSLIGQVGEGIVPVFHRATGRLFFLPKTLRVQEASEICNIPELKALYSGQYGIYIELNINRHYEELLNANIFYFHNFLTKLINLNP